MFVTIHSQFFILGNRTLHTVMNSFIHIHPEGTSIGSDNCDLSKVPDPHSKQWRIVLIASF